MNIIIKKKNQITHSIKVAIVTIAIFIAIGLIAHLTKKSDGKYINEIQSQYQLLGTHPSILVPCIRLHVSPGAKESAWTSALAETIGGETEVNVDFGRMDVLTDLYAIEVDFLPKWKEGLGQSLYYAKESKLIPVFAIIVTEPANDDLLKKIEVTCTEQGVKLILLIPES